MAAELEFGVRLALPEGWYELPTDTMSAAWKEQAIAHLAGPDAAEPQRDRAAGDLVALVGCWETMRALTALFYAPHPGSGMLARLLVYRWPETPLLGRALTGDYARKRLSRYLAGAGGAGTGASRQQVYERVVAAGTAVSVRGRLPDGIGRLHETLLTLLVVQGLPRMIAFHLDAYDPAVDPGPLLEMGDGVVAGAAVDLFDVPVGPEPPESR